MKHVAAPALCSLIIILALPGVVHAADETFAVQFLGSPLLILTALVVIAALASWYHRIRK
jgi:hypothetical protein